MLHKTNHTHAQLLALIPDTWPTEDKRNLVAVITACYVGATPGFFSTTGCEKVGDIVQCTYSGPRRCHFTKVVSSPRARRGRYIMPPRALC